MASAKRSHKHASKHRSVTLHSHHAKPYRKRHLFSLGFFTALILVVAFLGAQNIAKNSALRTDAQNAATSQANKLSANSNPIVLRSSLGFDLTFDPNIFSASATVIGTDGKPKTYDYAANTPTREYSLVQFVPASSDNSYDKSGLTVYAPQDKTATSAELNGIAQSYADRSDANFNVILTKTETVTISGVSFQKLTYDSVPKTKSGKTKLETVRSIIYAGLLKNNKPVIMKISDAVDTISPVEQYEALIATFEATGSSVTSLRSGQSELVAAASKVAKDISHFSLVSDANLFANRAEAAPLPDTSSRVTNEYTPAAVKVYHLNCGSITYLGQPLLSDGCDGVSGSGFFVSSDGYVATNGHVVSTSAKDIVAFSLNEQILRRILQIEGYTQAEIDALVDQVLADPTAAASILAAIYKLPEGALKEVNQKDVYLATLGKDAPDLKSFLTSRSYSDTSTIKNAQLIGFDYDSADLFSEKFTHSDVALIKLPGNNYPVTQLGSIDGVSKGSKLTVIGFPGVADKNGLTDSSKIEATTTSGSVSAIRDSNGGGKKLIQSDAKISHGNSGGPVFDESGKVFGIATYVLTGKDGDSSYSYMRDIQDLKDLAKEKTVSFNTQSATQKAWSDGLDLFYKARYTPAIAKFEEARKLYPSLALADDMIKTSRTKIANGEEVADPIWSILLWGVGIAALGGAVVTVVVISKHRVKHTIYTAAANGQPAVGFAAPQMATAGAAPAQPNTMFNAPPVPMGPTAPPAMRAPQQMPPAQQPQPQQPLPPQNPPTQPPAPPTMPVQ